MEAQEAKGNIGRNIPGYPAIRVTRQRIYFILLLFLLLEDNCFTMLCQFLLYNNVNQPLVCTYSLPLQPPSRPIPHPTLSVITEHLAELPVLHSRFLLPSVSQATVCISQRYSLDSSCPLLTTAVFASVLQVFISVSALKIGSPVPFFQIPLTENLNSHD